MTTTPGSPNTLQSIVKRALTLLKLIGEEIVVKEADLKLKAQQAERSVEDLLTALQNTEDVIVDNFEREMDRLEKDEIDWSEYQEPEE
jgi:hypothetical protein